MKTLPELGVGQKMEDVVVVVIPLSDTKFLKTTSWKSLAKVDADTCLVKMSDGFSKDETLLTLMTPFL